MTSLPRCRRRVPPCYVRRRRRRIYGLQETAARARADSKRKRNKPCWDAGVLHIITHICHIIIHICPIGTARKPKQRKRNKPCWDAGFLLGREKASRRKLLANIFVCTVLHTYVKYPLHMYMYPIYTSLSYHRRLFLPPHPRLFDL